MKKTLSMLFICCIANVALADCQHSAAIAEKFLNDYVKVKNSDAWLMRHKTLTHHFKNAYQHLVAEAKRQDPELGLDFDPIFNAQDYPEQGFKVTGCDEKTNIVTLSGKSKDWENFQVNIKVLPNTGQIDGAGVINMPQ